MLLLAGTGETAADWNCIAADLARDRMVHAVDLRGHGLSSWPGEYSIQAMADDVMELLPALGGPVDLVGHSLGGLVAAHAAQDSQWVSRLVLEDVGLPRPRIPSTPTRPEGALEFDWAMVEQIRPQIDQPDFPWEQIFSNIKVPTEIISGGRESFVPAELVEQLGGLIPDCSISTLQTGHLVHATDPDGFIRLVRAHLDGR
ncbi:alpha/beta hydrolase [Glutamicibacter sp.]|uniref:alpha/beta fold hydrolase n=1 Tax=Glutamicibacter sp. TaxID=1931995 RepID=UPI0028BE09D6|nr:alpha/beta hydrolase [Glutamicibacter sp.]